MVRLYKEKFTLSKVSYNQVKSSFLHSLSKSNYVMDSKALILFEEIVLNVLLHAKACSGTFLLIQVKQKPKGLMFLFVDDAVCFDLRTHNKTSSQSPGGWGIIFIKKLAKKIYYKRFRSKNYLLIGFS